MVGQFHFPRNVHLRPNPGGDLGGVPATRAQAVTLGIGGAGQAHHCVHLRLRTHLKKQRNDHHADRHLVGAPLFNMPLPQFAHARMYNRLEPGAGCIIAKHFPRHPLAVELAVHNEFRAKDLGNFLQGRLTGRHHFTCEIIGIHHRQSTLGEQARSRALAHADAAGEADDPRAHRAKFKLPATARVARDLLSV